MEVILLEKVRNLGALGDKVKVKSGYGRNYLVPHGKAVYATASNVAKFEVRRAELEAAEAQHLKEAQAKQQALAALKAVTIKAKAGEEGKLFGSVGTKDIAEAVTLAGVEINKADVHLPTGPLRTAGEHDVEISLHSDVDATVKILIVSEE